MPADHADIAIIIPYYRGAQYIHTCVVSIQESKLNCALYIIDNDPEGLPELSESKNIFIIKTVRRIGFGRAVNVGIYTAFQDGFTKIIILNQDTLVIPKSMNALVESLSRNSNDVCIPVITQYDTGKVSPHFEQRTWSIRKQIPEFISEPVSEVQIASAVCVSMHKCSIESVGYFDPLFFMYGEDDDWFLRLHQAGGRILLIEKARIRHAHSFTSAINKKREKISLWQLYSKTILSIRYHNEGLVHIFKNSISGIIRYKSFSTAVKILLLVFRMSAIRDASTRSINRRALLQIARDLKQKL